MFGRARWGRRGDGRRQREGWESGLTNTHTPEKGRCWRETWTQQHTPEKGRCCSPETGRCWRETAYQQRQQSNRTYRALCLSALYMLPCTSCPQGLSAGRVGDGQERVKYTVVYRTDVEVGRRSGHKVWEGEVCNGLGSWFDASLRLGDASC